MELPGKRYQLILAPSCGSSELAGREEVSCCLPLCFSPSRSAILEPKNSRARWQWTKILRVNDPE